MTRSLPGRSLLLAGIWSAIWALFFFPMHLLASSTSTNIGETASVISDCKVTNAPVNLKFGTYAPGTGNTATTTLSVECSNGTAATIGLDQGTNVNNLGGCSTTRAMNTSSANFLCYDLYMNSSYTTVWNLTTNTIKLSFTSFGALNTTIYGKIPAGQAPLSGAYFDFVGIFITF